MQQLKSHSQAINGAESEASLRADAPFCCALELAARCVHKWCAALLCALGMCVVVVDSWADPNMMKAAPDKQRDRQGERGQAWQPHNTGEEPLLKNQQRSPANVQKVCVPLPSNQLDRQLRPTSSQQPGVVTVSVAYIRVRLEQRVVLVMPNQP